MKFTTKEMIFSACLFAIGWAIYMGGKVLNDHDVDIERLKVAIQQLEHDND